MFVVHSESRGGVLYFDSLLIVGCVDMMNGCILYIHFVIYTGPS